MKLKNKLGKALKFFYFDRRGEYMLDEFKEYLKESGIIYRLNPRNTPQCNGIRERRNKTY